MSDDKKVIFLAYRNDEPTEATQEVLSCATCKNKTWKAAYFNGRGFPTLVCACCGHSAGQFGWVNEDEN